MNAEMYALETHVREAHLLGVVHAVDGELALINEREEPRVALHQQLLCIEHAISV